MSAANRADVIAIHGRRVSSGSGNTVEVLAEIGRISFVPK